METITAAGKKFCRFSWFDKPKPFNFPQKQRKANTGSIIISDKENDLKDELINSYQFIFCPLTNQIKD